MVVLTSFSAPTEGIKHQQPSTTLIVNGRDVGVGTLYIAESELSWKNNSSGEGVSLLYTQISVHAVSRDLERFGHECLYLITDYELDNELEGEENESDDENGERLSDGTEMRFVPADKGSLDAMFVAMNHCQALHPDPEAFVLSEDEDEDDEFLDAHEEGGNLHNIVGLLSDSGIVPDGRPNGFHRPADVDLDNLGMDMDTNGQFEDAED